MRIQPNPIGELTWIAGGEIDECSVSLRFFGNDLDPNLMTTIMGIDPTISYRKGDIFHGKISLPEQIL